MIVNRSHSFLTKYNSKFQIFMPTISTGWLIRGHRDLALRKRHKTCVELMINKMKLNFSSEYVSEYMNCHSLSLFFPQLSLICMLSPTAMPKNEYRARVIIEKMVISEWNWVPLPIITLFSYPIFNEWRFLSGNSVVTWQRVL